MSLWSIITGQDKIRPPQEDPLFLLSSVRDRLTAHGWQFQGGSGVAVKRYDGSAFEAASEVVLDLLQRYTAEHSMQVTASNDDYGYRWFLQSGGDVADHTVGLHSVSRVLNEHGFLDGILAAALKYTAGNTTFYLVYNFKRGHFYPFSPTGNSEARDTAAEFNLTAESPELPWEVDTGCWYPIWGIPV